MRKHAVVSIVDNRSFMDALVMMRLISQTNEYECYLCGDLHKINPKELELAKENPQINLFDTSKDAKINEQIQKIKMMVKYQQIQNQQVLIPFILSTIEADYISVISPNTIIVDTFKVPETSCDFNSALAPEYYGVRSEELSNEYLKQVTNLPGIKINLNYFTYQPNGKHHKNFADTFVKQVCELNEYYNLRFSIEEAMAFTMRRLSLEISYYPFASYPKLSSDLMCLPTLAENDSGLQLTSKFNNQATIKESIVANLVNLELIYIYYENLSFLTDEDIRDIITENKQHLNGIILIRNQQIQERLRRENEKNIINY